MRLPAPVKTQPVRSEQIILFRVSGQLFAVSSASVQEVRSVDTLTGASREITHAGVRKVRHIVQRGEHSLYVVNGAMHFGLTPSPAALVFVLRRTRTALLVDGIERMTTMTRLQALPQSFCHEERQWYRGLTALDQSVIPVVKPEGFLSPDELLLLDSSLEASAASTDHANVNSTTGFSDDHDAALGAAALGAAPFGFKGAGFLQPPPEAGAPPSVSEGELFPSDSVRLP